VSIFYPCRSDGNDYNMQIKGTYGESGRCAEAGHIIARFRFKNIAV